MIRAFVCLSILTISCVRQDVASPGADLDGNWVPEVISWERPDIDDPEIRNFRYASFATLSIRGQEFMMVESTNSPGDNDTINLFFEPGYNLYLGSVSLSDGSVIAAYRNVYRFIKINGDTINTLCTDTLRYADGILAFRNQRYLRTSTLDTADINRLWKHAYSVGKSAH
jgi:hypothetical protein